MPLCESASFICLLTTSQIQQCHLLSVCCHVDTGDSEEMLTDGYQGLYDHLAEGVNIKLETVVTKVL